MNRKFEGKVLSSSFWEKTRHRKGVTFIEVLVIISIILVLFALLLPAFYAIKDRNVNNRFIDAEIIRKYEVVDNGTTRFRIDYREKNKSVIDVLEVNSDYYNNYTGNRIYANLQEGHWYRIQICGSLDEKFNRYPFIKSIEKIPSPDL